MGSLYKQFTQKAINNFDDFHVAVLDIFKLVSHGGRKRRTKKRRLVISKKVKPSKLDDVTMITGIVSPAAAMAAKRAGENVPQLKLIKLIPDVIFVPTVTIMAIVSAKLSRRMYLK
ncbi:hypothetical protein N665_1332s0019 [Sinapis alba]|nr:hypothetical protein N665_1332s0019 [Sinapis alba]